MSTLIAPSILAADFANLQREVELLNSSQADFIHVDIMDGVFVPNISFGFPVMASLQKHAKKPLDVHLMIVEPDRYITRFAEYGTHLLSVHIEACPHLHRSIQAIKQAGMKAGVAINPHTSIQQLEDVIGDIDLVCLMSVNPGFGGQSFIQNTYRKIEKLNEMKRQHNLNFEIEIDGGVTLQNYKQLIGAGATVLVAGNTVFNSENPNVTISSLKQ
jgi:ribulose-phosphate 3-epimerase